ncbi:hypothetical protein [Echinimonas agarilytica]|uniref:Uncharacterized protein n=1 Tax=Echinimonas agarilytica TaxID=1215918 RepID=A0AA42B8D5_9GAMM|nr:hypothetical protein [Echinimonas agarilytica]MCM2680081.1 hypothetical protein [Echinimonas agarilytica]
MSTHNFNRPYYLTIIGLVVLALFVFILSISVTPETRDSFMKEGGPVESLSALGYLIAVAVMFFKGGKEYLTKYWYFAVMFLSFAARELDFDKRFTNFGVLKSKFFAHPDVSWWGKVIAAIILLVVLSAIITIVRRHGRKFIAEVFRFQWSPLVWSIGFAGGFLVVSKSLDGLARKLSGWGIAELSKETDKIASMAEEAMELAVPYLFIVAILYFLAKQKRA